MNGDYQVRKDIDRLMSDAYDLDSNQLNFYTKAEIDSQFYDTSEVYTQSQVDNLIEGMFDRIYPVGAIYISVNSVNPSELFGGVWEQIKDTFLLSSGDTYPLTEEVEIDGETVEVNATGGSADAVVVAHSHTYRTAPHTFAERDTSSSQVISPNSNQSSAAKYVTKTTYSEGVSGTGKNMPPYMAVNVWKRIE